MELINVGFQTHDQGSTSFSFVQFSRSCCAVSSRWQLVNYTTLGSVCQELFWSFFGFFEGFSTPAKPAQAVVMGFSAPAPRGTAWLYYHRQSYFVNRFFEFFDKFRAEFLGSVYIVVGWCFGTSCGEDGVCRKIARASNARPYRVVVLFIATKQLQIWYKE